MSVPLILIIEEEKKRQERAKEGARIHIEPPPRMPERREPNPTGSDSFDIFEESGEGEGTSCGETVFSIFSD